MGYFEIGQLIPTDKLLCADILIFCFLFFFD